jgi:MSHA biogenesis protein MshO
MLSRRSGFTLVELIVVMVVSGVLAGGMLAYFKPAVANYLAVGRRAGLSDLADGALRGMTRDIRRAVPNSVRLANSQCVELIPTSDGGRFRTGPDTQWDAANPASPSAQLDMSGAAAAFDVLTPLLNTQLANDWVVIGNQTGNDVYTGVNRAAIASVSAPPSPTLGPHRITLGAAKQFPLGYEGGRFVVVPDAQQAVFYVCANAGTDANGTGTGTLYRFSKYGFNASAPTVCPSATTSTPIVATKVAACAFVYDPNQGATQQSGFVEAQLTLSDQGESVPLSYGAHVDNVP